MKVYISWSGPVSREVALALRDWLPSVLQAVEPWLASGDIHRGIDWQSEIASNLSASSAVIFCVTRQNMRSGWLNFEAGAATRAVGARPIYPLCIDLPPSELSGPMAQFQAITPDKHGITLLVTSLNRRLDNPVRQDSIESIVNLWFPQFQQQLQPLEVASGSASPPEPGRLAPDREILESLAREVRALGEKLASIELSVVPTMESQEASETPSGLSRPRVFIGSSVEGLAVAESIQAGLDYVTECTVWNQAAFEPSKTTIEGLVEMSKAFDFAIIVMTADDTLTKKGNTTLAPRDNLVFELGLFTGGLGRAKTFLVKCRDDIIELPSDLQGVTTVEYGKRKDGNLKAAVSPVCLRMREVMGLR